MTTKTKAKYRFIEFIRPGCFWPYPYTVEQALGVFRWMIRTGEPYGDRGTWGTSNVLGLLSKKPSCVNFQQVDPITSVEDLRSRFHYAILSGCVGPSLRQWRDEFRITPDGVRSIAFQHGGDGPAKKEWGQTDEIVLDTLLGTQGRLGVQLNSYHSRAREIYGVKLYCRSAWDFELSYGYQGSVWRKTLSRQLPRETFWQAFNRASSKLASMIDGTYVEKKRA